MGIGERNRSAAIPGRVLLISPVPPPYGGMALQAVLLQKKLRVDGVSAELLGYSHPLPPAFRFLERIPGLRTLFRAGRFCITAWQRVRSSDVIHILAASWIYFFLIVCPAVLMSRLQGKRVILNYRGGDADQFLKWCGWLVKPVFQMADVITAPSGFLAQVIRHRVGLSVAIVPNIVDFSRFHYRDHSPVQPKMLVTRHLEELYGIESVLRAFRHIQSKHPTASLWIAGTGTQEAYLRNLASNWALRNVKFLGHIDHGSLAGVYDQCDILLNASRIDNFPASLMEASAAGLVVVSTDAGGIPFMYEHGKNALLAAIGDWQGLASEVECVLRQQDLARSLAFAGRQLCQQCDWANVRHRLYAVYGFAAPDKREQPETMDGARCLRT